VGQHGQAPREWRGWAELRGRDVWAGSSVPARPFDFHDRVGITGGEHQCWIPQRVLRSSGVCFMGGFGVGCQKTFHSERPLRDEVKEKTKGEETALDTALSSLL